MIPEPSGTTDLLNEAKNDTSLRMRIAADYMPHAQQVARTMLNWSFPKEADRIRSHMDSADLGLKAVEDILKSERVWESEEEFTKQIKPAIGNDCRDIIRAYRRQDARTEPQTDIPKDDDIPELVALGEVIENMKQWKSSVYCVFMMRFFNGMSNAAIAKKLNMDRNTVATHWKMALGFMGRNGYGE